MTIQEATAELALLQKKMHAFNHATGMIYLDSVTVAPKDTAEGRGETLGILSSISYEIFANPKTEELLKYLADHRDELTEQQVREVVVLTRDYERISKIPQEEYVAYQMMINEAQRVWHRAKEKTNYAFCTLYQKFGIFEKIRGYFDPDEKPIYGLIIMNEA